MLSLRFTVAILLTSAAWGQKHDAFETTVQPILKSNCLGCHNSKNKMSGLNLETRDAAFTGGNRGAAIEPGKPDESRLIQAVLQSGDLKMPPGGRLKDEQVQALKAWVSAGAVWPQTAKAESNKPMHWSLLPPKQPALPQVKTQGWARTPIDKFILARLEKENLTPSPEADKRTLLRRVSLDLTGLPPSPREIDEFLADTRADAYERTVDRLLSSQHYGERWGRHWLDLARYADSNGYNLDDPREIWKYRDWVIDAFNRDLPFNQFVIEQIAGDMLPKPTTEQLIATGFHRNTPLNLEGGIDHEQYRVEAVIDRVDTTGQVFLGLSLGCARCHDHKFDPITQREFYQIYSFFNNIDELSGTKGRDKAYEPLLELATPEELARRNAVRTQLGLLKKEFAEYGKALSADQKKTDLGYLERKKIVDAVTKLVPPVTTTLIMQELPQPREAFIQLGGDFLRKGATVTAATPASLHPLRTEGRPTRLDLARWLVDPANPLTARVTVNRIWLRYFGRGIVETDNDFGTQGSRPTHPELLDWLATEFVAKGWSQKALHRAIVTSSVYRQASTVRKDLEAVDPDNRLLARQTRVRLDAEVIRDSALTACGLLSPKLGGPSVFPPQPEGASKLGQRQREWVADTGPNRYRRAMYTYFYRGAPHPVLTVFDAPDSTTTCTRRSRSSTPLQALTLLNDTAFYEFAQGLAARVLKEAPASDAARMEYAFRLTVGRAPRAGEAERLRAFLAGQLDDLRTHPEDAKALTPADTTGDPVQLAAWTAASRVLLNLDEFITRE